MFPNIKTTHLYDGKWVFGGRSELVPMGAGRSVLMCKPGPSHRETYFMKMFLSNLVFCHSGKVSSQNIHWLSEENKKQSVSSLPLAPKWKPTAESLLIVLGPWLLEEVTRLGSQRKRDRDYEIRLLHAASLLFCHVLWVWTEATAGKIVHPFFKRTLSCFPCSTKQGPERHVPCTGTTGG